MKQNANATREWKDAHPEVSFMQKDVECHCCHEVGHIATNCPKLAKKKEAKMSGFQAPLGERAEERIC